MAKIKSKLFANIKKKIVKKHEDIIIDLEEPATWASSGNFVLNHILSGQFGKGYPAGRITQLFGDSGSGKSFLTARAIVDAQKDGYWVVVIDSEQAVSQDYLQSIGVKIDEEKLMTFQATTVEQAQDIMIEVLDGVKEEQAGLANKSDMKLMLIVDSLGLLASSKAIENAEANHHTADMGTKAKALTKMFTAVTQKIGKTDAVCLMTNHGAMEIGVMFPVMKPKGGQSCEYVPSISLRITKGKLQEKNLEELAYLYGGNIPKHLNSLGIVARIELYKSRFTRPFRKVQLMIPYDFGLPEYAGLFDYLKDNGIITAPTRQGWYNTSICPFDKDFTRKKFIEDGYAEKIMKVLLKEEKKKPFDFIMKSAEDIAKEQAENAGTVSEEINDSVEG